MGGIGGYVGTRTAGREQNAITSENKKKKGDTKYVEVENQLDRNDNTNNLARTHAKTIHPTTYNLNHAITPEASQCFSKTNRISK